MPLATSKKLKEISIGKAKHGMSCHISLTVNGKTATGYDYRNGATSCVLLTKGKQAFMTIKSDSTITIPVNRRVGCTVFRERYRSTPAP